MRPIWCALLTAVVTAVLMGLGLATRSTSASATWPVVLQVRTPGFSVADGFLRVPGYANADTPGAPALPFWSTQIELPPAGAARVSVQSAGFTTHAVPVPLRAAPVPDLSALRAAPWTAQTDLPAFAPTVDRPDPAVYGRDAFYPDPLVQTVEQVQQGKRLLLVRVFPLQYNPVQGIVHHHAELTVTVDVEPAGSPAVTTAPSAPGVLNPPAVSGAALRLHTGEGGLYRLTHADLLAAGVPLDAVDPATFAVYYLGQPTAIEVTGNGDDRFDPDELVIFVAEPYTGRYQTHNVYWFTWGDPAGALRMETRAVTPDGSEPVVTVITRTLTVERNTEYQSTFPRPRDADHWFDLPLSVDVLGAATAVRTYDLALQDPLPVGEVVVEALAHGGLDRPLNPDKALALALNGRDLGLFTWEGRSEHLATAVAPAAWLDGAPNRIALQAALSYLPGIDFYSVSPDWVRLRYPSAARAVGDRLWIEGWDRSALGGAAQVAVQVSGFTTGAVSVYDARNPRHPVRLLTTAADLDGSTYRVQFWDADAPAPVYALSSRDALRAPLSIVPDAPSDWGVAPRAADYIAVVHASLMAAVQPLLDHRAADGLRVAAVDVQDVYDEFAFGRRDPEAIRSFLAHAYQTWNPGEEPPGYVLLVGDGHYDFTGVSGTTLPNLIPPYLVNVDPWLGETAADNRYVSFDGPDDYLPEMVIGRIPANSAADVTAVVAKIIAYETTTAAGAWQGRVVFVADSNSDPAGDFHALSDDIRLNWLPSQYDGQMIYYRRDYMTGAAMRTAIMGAFDSDALMIQWFGHGSRFRWGSVSMVRNTDVPLLAANDNWPFTVSYSCWTGYFVNLFGNQQTLGEQLVITPQRGSIADLSPSGQHIGSSLLVFNRAVVQATLQDRTERLGDAVNAARLAYFAGSSSFHDVIDTMVLFGDPALKLRLPPVPTAVGLQHAAAAAPPTGGAWLPVLLTLCVALTAVAWRRNRLHRPIAVEMDSAGAGKTGD